MDPHPSATPYSLRGLLRYFLRLGATGFGGPIALAGYMQRDLVEQRRWLSAQEFKEGLALAQLAPGPLAAQLAIYLGWTRGGVVGATLTGVLFVLPSFLMVLGISALYVSFGGLPWMQGAFYGIGAAVIALIGRSAVKLARLTLGRDRLAWMLCIVSAAVTAVTESEWVWLFLLAGVVNMAVLGRFRLPQAPTVLALLPAWGLSGVHGPATAATLWHLGWYFTEAGAFVFGSGLAIVPFLYSGVVQRFHWLTEQQFIDAVAVAMITPGPVVITVAFIGYLTAGPLGALVAALATFLPCYLFTVLPAPYFKRFAHNLNLKAFVDGVTAAATGAIAGAAIVLGRRALYDIPTILIALGTLLLLLSRRRIPEPILILLAAVVGLVVRSQRHN